MLEAARLQVLLDRILSATKIDGMNRRSTEYRCVNKALNAFQARGIDQRTKTAVDDRCRRVPASTEK
jgi:hypothetical protein